MTLKLLTAVASTAAAASYARAPNAIPVIQSCYCTDGNTNPVAVVVVVVVVEGEGGIALLGLEYWSNHNQRRIRRQQSSVQGQTL